ncbi:hypothetical protein CYMTET_38875 [Cymbomonas tetramitiformis]|uniref:Protein kinase domain-containing protein n=1 Tax=Cymbomonas tetramitiformis TaxID=36881 RepID=A0AAE0CB58_9CHLO|nr:hypothetical protein CYMTET_38875 [Cymbomonas tetramitiformis]
MLSQAAAQDIHAAPHHHLNTPLQFPGFHHDLSVESLSKRFLSGDPDACLSNLDKIAKQCGVPRVSRQQVVTYRAPQDSQATGQGSYGSVLLHCTLDKTERAVLKDFTDPALHRRLRHCAVELYMNTVAHFAAPTTVVPCLGYGAQICPDHSAFLVMKYGGETLADFLTSRGSGIPIQAMRHLVIDLFRGISDLHAAGIVHGDLKGNNVLVQENLPDVGGHSLKLIDFGLARFHRTDSMAPLPPVNVVRSSFIPAQPDWVCPDDSLAALKGKVVYRKLMPTFRYHVGFVCPGIPEGLHVLDLNTVRTICLLEALWQAKTAKEGLPGDRPSKEAAMQFLIDNDTHLRKHDHHQQRVLDEAFAGHSLGTMDYGHRPGVVPLTRHVHFAPSHIPRTSAAETEPPQQTESGDISAASCTLPAEGAKPNAVKGKNRVRKGGGPHMKVESVIRKCPVAYDVEAKQIVDKTTSKYWANNAAAQERFDMCVKTLRELHPELDEATAKTKIIRRLNNRRNLGPKGTTIEMRQNRDIQAVNAFNKESQKKRPDLPYGHHGDVSLDGTDAYGRRVDGRMDSVRPVPCQSFALVRTCGQPLHPGLSVPEHCLPLPQPYGHHVDVSLDEPMRTDDVWTGVWTV